MLDSEAFARATMIVVAVVGAVLVVFLFLVALLPTHVQAQVRGPIIRGTEHLMKVLDGTASAFAVVAVFATLGMVIASILLIAATLLR